eukprot:TRINITY_DN11325_c0_g1_i2.p1 TRINITY_DN11325_c0_g1~~TRINITY_DN11325_c0_g1_i2.p1  ORF type:complete len:516 (+),score=88.41 TRINITY_DN11325_c0_g1_i2:73-1620(+)
MNNDQELGFLFPASLCCPLCQQPFAEAVTSTVCGHSFCLACVQREASSNQERVVLCPNDGQSTPLDAFVSNLALQQQVDEYPCPCNYQGCDLRVPWAEYHQHRIGCGFRPLACPNSGECTPMLQRDVSKHLESCQLAECKYSVIGCPFRGLLRDKLNHEAGCSFGLDSQETVVQQNIQTMVTSIARLQQQYEGLVQRIAAAQKSLAITEREVAQQRLKAVEFEMPFTFKCLGSFKGHSGPVWALASINNTMFTASADMTIKCWDLSRMSCISTLKGHQGVIHCLTVGGGKLFSADSEGQIICWNPETLVKEREIDATSQIISSMQASKQRLFVASYNTVKVYQLSDLSLIAQFDDYDRHWVRALLLHPNGNIYIAFANNVQIRDFNSLSVITTIKTDHGSIRSLAVTHEYLILGTFNQNIQLYRLSNLSHVCPLTMHVGSITTLTISAEGNFLFSGSEDGTVNIWSLKKKLVVQTLSRHNDEHVHALAWHRGFLLSGGADNEIKLYRYQKLEQQD